MPIPLQRCLVSCCLLGLATRYDGCSKPNNQCIRMLEKYHYIPICPEQLGGLPTPRPAAEIIGGTGLDVLEGRAAVITVDGINVSAQFIAGAEAVLAIAQAQHITLAMLKAKSPSCGSSTVLGVTAALLQQHGVEVLEF